MEKLLAKLFIKDYKNVQNVAVANQYGKMAGIVGIGVNFLLAGSKIALGLLSGSIAVVSDGINNLSDAGGSLVTAVGFKLASLPADDEHPFGHQRIEYITGLIVSFLVLFIGFILGYKSIQNIIHPVALDYRLITLIALALSILFKVGLCIFYKRVSRLINSPTLNASATDSLTDVFSTGAVLVAIIISKIFNLNLDGYLGLIVSIIIIIQGLDLIKETTSPLLGEAPSKDLEALIKNTVERYPQVLDVHDIVIHTYGHGEIFVSAHLEFDEDKSFMEVHEISDRIEHEVLKDYHIYLTTHADPVDLSNEALSLKQHIIHLVSVYNDKLSLHDFRVIQAPTKTKILFDIKVPQTIKKDPSIIKQEIIKLVKSLDEQYEVIIDIDEQYNIF